MLSHQPVLKIKFNSWISVRLSRSWRRINFLACFHLLPPLPPPYYATALMRTIILQCCRIVEPSSTTCNIEVICAKVCKKPFTRCKKFLFNFPSTLCNFLEKEIRYSKNVDASIIAQKVYRLFRALGKNVNFKENAFLCNTLRCIYQKECLSKSHKAKHKLFQSSKPSYSKLK